MNIQDLKSQLFANNGLARSSKWVVQIFPPRGSTALGNVISNTLSSGSNRVEVNLPIFDALDEARNTLNNLNVNFGGTNLSFNPDLPPLGYAITNDTKDTRNVSMLCSDVQIPARDVSEFEYKTDGEPRSIGYIHNHGNLDMEFYCSENLRERSFFENWQDLIYNRGSVSTGYYDDYISRVEVIKYNASMSEVTARYRFNEVYPTNIGTFELNSETALLKLNVQFKYRNYDRIE
jgi:hypothetical protein